MWAERHMMDAITTNLEHANDGGLVCVMCSPYPQSCRSDWYQPFSKYYLENDVLRGVG